MDLLTHLKTSCHFKPWHMWLLPTCSSLCSHSGIITILSFPHTVLVCLTWVLPRCTLGNLQALKVIRAPACDERELIRAADLCLHADFGSRQAAVNTVCSKQAWNWMSNHFCLSCLRGHHFQHILFCILILHIPSLSYSFIFCPHN